MLKGYRDRWDLLQATTDRAPVLLEAHWREQAQLEQVGLPPGHPWHQQLPTW